MKKSYFLLIFFLWIQVSISAQVKEYHASRIDQADLRIDGKLDEKIWTEGEWEGNFSQFEPNNGEAPSQQSVFKLYYDDDNLYLAIKNYDSEAHKIDRRMTRRDGFEGDLCGIELDSYFDKRTAFVFLVNAAGVKTDGIFTGDGDDLDFSLDPIWFVKTKIVTDGWQAEMKIPLSQLRFGQENGAELTWGMQVTRFLFRKEELNLWQPISKEKTGWISQFGNLKGLKDLHSKKLVEVAPYVLSKLNTYEEEEGNPFRDGLDMGIDAGLDTKIGITNDLILDMAINPDFGQVEADPSEVNLTAFETFFREKRPFFIEGTSITNYQITPGGNPWSSDNLFYSRRVGRSPQFMPELMDEEFMDFPGQSRILGAAKLTGKSKGGWSVGLIENLVNREVATIDLMGERRDIRVEPLTNYLVGRVQKDIKQGNTIVGAMLTATNRFDDDGQFDFLIRDAYTAGLDFMQFFKQKTYFFGASFIGSALYGSQEALFEQQTSPRRYYQRPDADYLEVDENSTSMYGHGGNFMMGRSGNSGFRFLNNVTWRSPGLELNDLGYMRRADNVFQFLWASYEILNPVKALRQLQVNVNEWAGWDFGGTRLFTGMNINLNTQFSNLWSMHGNVNYDFSSIDNGELRGGPALHYPGSRSVGIGIESSNTKKLVAELNYFRGWNTVGNSVDQMVNMELKYRPINTLSIYLEQQVHLSRRDLQYVDQYTLEEEDQYLFGALDQKLFSTTLRLDYNITPDLTLQYYGSPFITAGLYDKYKRVTHPAANDYFDRFDPFEMNEIRHIFNQSAEQNFYEIDRDGNGIPDFSFDNPDFNFKQFRSNLVARWEYQPGSVLYLVWSEDRTDFIDNGNINYLSDMKELFRITANDVFLIKLSHRFRFDR